MSKIHGMMDTGRRSMANSQTALQTVGHNIANKSTEGYSRQRVEMASSEPVGFGKTRVGTGAKTAMITRVNNPYLEKQIGAEMAKSGFFEGKADAMTRVESVYNEQQNKGLNTSITEFFNAFREFSNNPESLATRTQVKETAEFLTKDFKRVNSQLNGIAGDVDQQIATHVNEINDITKEIASLNEKVQLVQVQGGPGNDERDRRDLLIKQLGEKINIRWAEGANGQVAITAGNSALLVSGYDAMELSVRSTPATETKAEGNYDIFYQSSKRGEAYKVTDQFNGGKIGGLLDVRDNVVGGLHEDIDNMASSLMAKVNEVHRQGVDAYNQQAGDFFTIDERTAHAAEGLEVNAAVSNDVGRIAAAEQRNSPGDNRVATKIHELQFHGMVGEDKTTLDEFYNTMVGKVGLQSKRTQSSQQAQADVLKNLSNIRESISGVSLDEETTKLIEFQKAFDASARLIKTADEMFDTVLSLKR